MQDSVLTTDEAQRENDLDETSEMPVTFQTPKIAEKDLTKQEDQVSHTEEVTIYDCNLSDIRALDAANVNSV